MVSHQPGLVLALVVAGGVGIARKRVQDQDRVRSLLVQGAVGLVGERERRQGADPSREARTENSAYWVSTQPTSC